MEYTPITYHKRELQAAIQEMKMYGSRQSKIMLTAYYQQKQQNADLVAALEDTQKLLDNIYEEDIVLSTNMDAVYEKNKQALAQVGETNKG